MISEDGDGDASDAPEEARRTPISPSGAGSGLVLVGYRGTGKSTVGRIIAHRVGCPMADADAEVERVAGRSIRSIFEIDGEPAFRDMESKALEALASAPWLIGGVLATGGGAILRDSNRRALRSFGLVVWLVAEPEVLARRLSGHRQGTADRPPLTPAGTLGEVAEVLEARTPLYRAASDVAIETGTRSIFDVADRVVDAWRAALAASGPHPPMIAASTREGDLG